MQLTKQPTTTTTIICGCRMPLFCFPLSLSLCHPRRRMTFAYMLFKWEWHYVAHAFHGIARHRICLQSCLWWLLPATCLLPPASCHRTAPTTCRQQLPPPPQLQLQVATATATASCCWCQLQMSFSAVAAWKSGRAQAYATAKCPFLHNQKKKSIQNFKCFKKFKGQLWS